MWKSNWHETKLRFTEWWDHKGVLIGMWGAPELNTCIHEQVAPPTACQRSDVLYEVS